MRGKQLHQIIAYIAIIGIPLGLMCLILGLVAQPLGIIDRRRLVRAGILQEAYLFTVEGSGEFSLRHAALQCLLAVQRGPRQLQALAAPARHSSCHPGNPKAERATVGRWRAVAWRVVNPRTDIGEARRRGTIGGYRG